MDYLGADVEWLHRAESRFHSIAGKEKTIGRATFKKAVEVRNAFFADRMFTLLDRDRSDTLSKQELVAGLYLLTKGTPEQRIRFFFDVYDLDGDGAIDVTELRGLLTTGLDESSVQLGTRNLRRLTAMLLNAADLDSDGVISFDDFVGTLRRYPDLMANITLSAASWLEAPRTKGRRRGEGSPWPVAGYLRNNAKLIVFMAGYFLVNSALFAQAALYHSSAPDANWCFLIARGCGQALNFSSSLVVVLMLRTTLTHLRSTGLGSVLPFDHATLVHRAVGYVIVALATGHTLGHVGNALILQEHEDFTAVELLFTNTSILPVGLPVGRLVGSAFLTGWVLDLVLLILVLGSLPYVRRSGHFEIFIWTHKICYLSFWLLLILHGPRFWCWFLGPALLFTLEKISQMKVVRFIRFGKTYVKEANLLPSGVTHLVLTRPRTFKYKCGDYVFIQIPVIAKHEWHPFTISSAPEQDDISLHIRSAGNWTKRLHHHFDRMHLASRGKARGPRSALWGLVRRAFLGGEANRLVQARSDRPASAERAPGDTCAVELGGRWASPSPSRPASGASSAGRRAGLAEPSTGCDAGGEYTCPVDDGDGDGYVVAEPPAVVRVRRLSFPYRLPSCPLRPGWTPYQLPDSVEEKPDEEDRTATAPGAVDRAADTAGARREGTAKHGPSNGRSDRWSFAERGKPNIVFDLDTTNKVQVHIQGPYGTPSTIIFHSEHAVLIGAGIGVTPFASIIQSIMCRQRSLINKCPNCQNSWVDEERSRQAFKVKKVDFVWLNRNHTAFEWFVDLLLGLEQQQSQYSLDRFLDLHLYMTGIKRFDMKNVGIQMALDMVHEKEQKDMLTGLRTKLQTGRPDWAKLFQGFKEADRGRVSVFFCGAPSLAQTVNKVCHQFGFRFHKEVF